MKNKIKRYKFGFTIAELLITMFIAMIVAAAMVPIVGPKKVKFPEFNKIHGIYECYWDENNILKEYYADTENVDGELNAIEGVSYCTFNPPAGADYYEIYAISSGTVGYDPSVGFSSPPVMVQDSYDKDSDNDIYINEGDIRLEHFSYDLKNIRAKVTDDLYKIYPDPENKPQETITLSEAVRKIFKDKWAKENNDAYDKPYAVITKMNSQVGAVGGGLAYYVSVEKCTNNTLFYKKGSYVKGKIGKYGDGYSIEDYKKEMEDNGYCHGYLHVPGSGAYPGIKLADGYKILIPLSDIDGVLYTHTGSKNGTDTAVSIGLKNQSSFQVQYVAQIGGGGDAYHFGNDNYFLIPIPANNARYVNLKYNESIGKIKYAHGDKIINDLEGFQYWNLAYSDFLTKTLSKPFDIITNPGSEHGQEISISNGTDGSGGNDNYCYQKNGYCIDKKDDTRIEDEIEYVDNAFKWWQAGIKAKVDYKLAGSSGNMQVYRTNNLGDGPIYLFPDKDNTQSTIVSKSDDPTKMSDYIVSALNVEEPSETSGTDGWYILYKYMLPYPLNYVIDKTVPDNGKFSYIEAIKSSRFRNAIDNICVNDEYGITHCPGFGGAGAYPLISVFNTNFSVGVTNNQDFRRGKEFTQSYDANYNYRTENLKADGTEPDIPCKGDAGISFKDGDYDVCRGSNQGRGKGAVIILW